LKVNETNHPPTGKLRKGIKPPRETNREPSNANLAKSLGPHRVYFTPPRENLSKPNPQKNPRGGKKRTRAPVKPAK